MTDEGTADSAGRPVSPPIANTDTTADDAPARDFTDAASPWRRLDPRMLLIRPIRELIKFLPVLIVAFVVGANSEETWREGIGLAATALVVLFGVLHWFTTRYRVGPDQVELRTGLVSRRRLGVPREVIRTVDLKAELLHRMFGLTALTIGTGQHEQNNRRRLVLDALTAAEAQRLRTVLLHRPDARSIGRSDTAESNSARSDSIGSHSAGPDSAIPDGVGIPAPAGVAVATLDARWVRYAPFTLSGFAALAAAFGAAAQVVNQLGADPSRIGLIRSVVQAAERLPISSVVTIGAVVLLVVVTVASIVGYVFAYWSFTLTREPEGTLHIQRGLLTQRSISIEERRLRGVELKESLPLRLVRGAKCVAVAAGLQRVGEPGSDRSGGGVLLPPAPRKRAHEVAAEVLREDFDPTAAPLYRHPRAALRRRITRSVGTMLIIAAGCALLAMVGWWPNWPWQTSLVLAALAIPLGWDRYRSLGHRLTDRYLLTRHGSLMRTTSAIRRDGVIGWRIDQSYFQRRAGVVTVHAVTGTAAGAHPVIDVDAGDAIALLAESDETLLAPFLRTGESDGPHPVDRVPRR